MIMPVYFTFAPKRSQNFDFHYCFNDTADNQIFTIVKDEPFVDESFLVTFFDSERDDFENCRLIANDLNENFMINQNVFRLHNQIVTLPLQPRSTSRNLELNIGIKIQLWAAIVNYLRLDDLEFLQSNNIFANVFRQVYADRLRDDIATKRFWKKYSSTPWSSWPCSNWWKLQWNFLLKENEQLKEVRNFRSYNCAKKYANKYISNNFNFNEKLDFAKGEMFQQENVTIQLFKTTN